MAHIAGNMYSINAPGTHIDGNGVIMIADGAAFRERFRQRREELRLSQLELAWRLRTISGDMGWGWGSVHAWEKGADHDYVLKISPKGQDHFVEALETTADWLLWGNPHPRRHQAVMATREKYR